MIQPGQTSSVQRKLKLRWFQFSIRTLLLVMVFLCCGLGCLGWLLNDVREQADEVKMIQQLNGSVGFGEPSFLGRMGVVRSLLGEHAFAPITHMTLGQGTTDAHFLQLKQAKKLKSLLLDQTQVTDLSPLAGLRELTRLVIRDAPLRDLSPLAGLSNLTYLRLDRTRVSDLSPLTEVTSLTEVYLVDTAVANLSPLTKMNRLKSLDLKGTPVTDLSPLTTLSALTYLDLERTPVSDLTPLAGMNKLQVVWISHGKEVRIPESQSGIVFRH